MKYEVGGQKKAENFQLALNSLGSWLLALGSVISYLLSVVGGRRSEV